MSAIATVSLCRRKSLKFRSLRQLLVTSDAVADDQPGRVDPGRLHVLGVRAGIANMRVGQGDDLAAVRGIRQDLLVSGHRRIENDFTDGLAVSTNGSAFENGAILQSQYSS